MPLEFKKEDMFSEAKHIKAEALINTVNCVGVMGKGIALEFKKRWKRNYTAYKKLCDSKELSPGKMFVFENEELLESTEPKFIINFPTKNHWRSDSKIEFIETGLDALIKEIENYKIKSLIMPALGCGNGGLSWQKVKTLIQQKLSALTEGENAMQITVIEPNIQFKMTFERAVLLQVISEIHGKFGSFLKKEELYAIMYILQTYGAKFKLKFSKGSNTPRCPAIDEMCTSLENSAIINQMKEPIGIALTKYGEEILEKYFNSHKYEQVKSADFISILKENINSEKRDSFVLPIVVHWLQKMKNKDNQAIEKILSGKSIKKILPKKLTEQDIKDAFSISAQIQKTKPVAWSLEPSPYSKTKHMQLKKS